MNKQRYEQAAQLRAEKKTFRQIGEALGVGPSRARQMVLRAERIRKVEESRIDLISAIPVDASGAIDLSTPIESLELTQRTANCLKAEEIFTFNDLIKWRSIDLLKTTNLGKKGIVEIESVLLALGLSLK